MAQPKLIPLLAGLLLLAGCQTTAKLPKTVQVEIPVYVRPVPPEALVQCGKEPADFRFYSHPDSNDVFILEKDQPKFQAWVNRKNQCLQAWRNWSQP